MKWIEMKWIELKTQDQSNWGKIKYLRRKELRTRTKTNGRRGNECEAKAKQHSLNRTKEERDTGGKERRETKLKRREKTKGDKKGKGEAAGTGGRRGSTGGPALRSCFWCKEGTHRDGECHAMQGVVRHRRYTIFPPALMGPHATRPQLMSPKCIIGFGRHVQHTLELKASRYTHRTVITPWVPYHI